MTTISPDLFPGEGLRKVSPTEALQRLKALRCTLPQDNRPTCSGQLFVGIFFDGTGNNMRLDYELPPPEKRKHTNVVKLFQAHPTAPTRPGHYRFYIPGVGTPFPEIGEDTASSLGSSTAERAEDRIIWAFTRLLNAPHQFTHRNQPLIPDDQAQTICSNLASSGSPGAMRRLALNTWQDKLAAALKGKRPTVEQINLSVFGFSRGAAQARAFTNWLFEVCKPAGGGWTFAGLPLRLQFLGLFDTVASVGLADLMDDGVVRGHQSWADDNLQIHPAVERCVHYVAGHEVRACFPGDSVRVKNQYPANAVEVMYPGAHSDVGGGYAPSDLGVSPKQDSFLSIIPGASMFHEARKAGVPLNPFELLDQQLQDALTPSKTVITDFNAYLKSAKTATAPVEELHRRHMSLYFSHRYKRLNRNDYFASPPYRDASDADRRYLYSTQHSMYLQFEKLYQQIKWRTPQGARLADFFTQYRGYFLRARGSWEEISANPSAAGRALDAVWAASLPGRLVGAAKTAQERRALERAIEVAQHIRVEALTPEIETFFERYLHDSMAGFISMGMDEYSVNGIGITKFRSFFKGND